jgi:hypothetical protein
MCSSNDIVTQLLLTFPHLPSLTGRGRSKEQKIKRQEVNVDLVKVRNKRTELTAKNKWVMQLGMNEVSCLCTNMRELA